MALNQSLVGARGPALSTMITGATLSAWQNALGGPADGPARVAGLTVSCAAISPVLLDPRLGADMMRLGQVDHHIATLAPLSAGDVVDTVATIAGIHQTEAGERLELHLVSTCRGAVVVDATAGVLLRGPRRKTPLVEAPPAPGRGGADAIVMNRERIGRLCDALGDHNPLFLDDDAARQAGLPGCVAPNLGLVALAWQALAAPSALSLSFLRPALLDDTISIERDGSRFRVVNQVGIVLADGVVGGDA